MMENIDFEEKVDIDDLVLPSKPMETAEIEINDIKQEPVEEEQQQAAFESNCDVKKSFKLKMEENILKLYEELDKEKSHQSTMDFSLRRSLKIRQFVEMILQYDPLERCHEIKPFSCKFCDQSFRNVNEVKEHIKIHNSISEVKDLKNQVKSLKTQVEELEMKLKNDLLRKVNVQSKQEITEPEVDQKGTKDIWEQTADMNQLNAKNSNARKEKRKFACGGRGKNLNVKTKRTANTQDTKGANEKMLKKKIECEICYSKFDKICNKKRHVKTVHESKRIHECHMCDSTFGQKAHLKRHVEAIHEKKKKIKCKICLFTFIWKHQLTDHEKKCKIL
jgi:hypothetical protein